MISKFPNKKLCECRDYVYVLLTVIFMPICFYDKKIGALDLAQWI